MSQNIIEVSQLAKHFTMPKTRLFQTQPIKEAVKGITFHIKEGETFGLVGESGCGKSTTGNMLAGLLAPTAGEILFDGLPINVNDRSFSSNYRKNVQMIFQDPFSSLNPRKPIGWILEEPLRVNRMGNKKQRKEKVIRMLKEVGFDESYYNRFPHELSGGQRQRVVICAALMVNPRLIIADEPVSALDVSVQSTILNLMKDLQEKYKLTYLFISHDLNVVEYMSDRIGVMYNGNIVEMGDVDTIYNQSKHPYTHSLIDAIPTVYETKYNQQRKP